MQAVTKARPWWRYSAINDSRTRMTHSALHGRVVRHDDPFWDKFYPPNGFRCRCTVTSLSDRDLDRKGYTPETIEPGQLLEIPDGPQKGRAVPVMPDNNFQNNPGKSYWQADTLKYRADVRQLVLADLAASIPDGLLPDSEDYARLKRHLTQDDLQDMQTLVWARETRVRQEFTPWAEQALARARAKGEVYPVAKLPAGVLNKIEKQPRLAMVTLDDTRLVALKKQTKGTLSVRDIRQLPDRLTNAEWSDAGGGKFTARVPVGRSTAEATVTIDHDLGKGRVANHITGMTIKE
jgi:hypothetical protein